MNNKDSSERPDNRCSRRDFLAGTAGILPVALATTAIGADPAATRKRKAKTLPPPKYMIAVHMNANFARQAKSMSVKERFELAAREGAKAYQVGAFGGLDLDNYRRNADKHRMRCASLAGTGNVGLSTGLTATGKEKAYLDFFTKAVQAATVLGAQNLVSFVGERQDDIPWETQYGQIISGLKKAGDIAGEAGVYLTLEPLNPFWKPKMTVMTAQEGFEIVREVNHPHVKLDFDIHHLQQSEGNLTRNLRKGMAEGLIQFVEVGGVPERVEPGLGEVNYSFIFDELRRLEFDGFIGMEHFTKVDFPSAFARVKRLAGVS